MKIKRILFCALMLISTSMMAQFNWNKNPVIAHRGAFLKNKLPENSIASLKEAIRLGCYGSEFDVHQTADGVLVVNHDPDYEGMLIAETTYKKLKKHRLKNGEEIPTVEAYLKTGMKQKATKLILEIKPVKDSLQMRKVTDAVVALVKKVGATPWVEYISFDYSCLLRVRELNPKAKTAYLNGDKSLGTLKEDGLSGADYHFTVYKNGDWFQQSKTLGLTLNAWTVNKGEDMEWLLSNQVEFITTNEPELLFAILEKASL